MIKAESSEPVHLGIDKSTCGSFLLNVEECVHQRTRQGGDNAQITDITETWYDCWVY